MKRAVGATGVLVLLLAGCQSQASSAAPPWQVCGHTLWSAVSGVVVTDATERDVTVSDVTSGGNIALLTTASCAKGTNLTIEPTSAATIDRRSLATDGRVNALLLHPKAARFHVVIDGDQYGRRIITVALQSGVSKP